jgi:FtsH-binding integral membrane protein
MSKIGVRFVTMGILYTLLAMSLGIWMGVNQDFQNAHLHAHINLVAGVWFILFALVYKAYPAMASVPLASFHFWLANLGAAIFLPGIYIAMNYDNPLLAIIGSLLSVAAMAVFLINFRRNYDAADPSSSLADSLAISARRPVV